MRNYSLKKLRALLTQSLFILFFSPPSRKSVDDHNCQAWKTAESKVTAVCMTAVSKVTAVCKTTAVCMSAVCMSEVLSSTFQASKIFY